MAVTSSIGRYQQSAEAEAATAEVYAPTSALGDYRLDASLSDLVADGIFVLGERRTLLDRECQVYRTGSTLESYTISAPTETDYSDICIDAAGLMLEELSVASGEVTQHRVATAVDPAADVADDDFTISATPTDLAGGGSELAEIDMTTGPVAGFWSFAEPPAGYEFQHRYVLRQTVTEPASDAPDNTGGTTSTSVPATTVAESYIDVYVDGINVITVRQGPRRSIRASTPLPRRTRPPRTSERSRLPRGSPAASCRLFRRARPTGSSKSPARSPVRTSWRWSKV